MQRPIHILLTLAILSGIAFAQNAASFDEATGNYQIAVAAAEQAKQDSTEALKTKYAAALGRLKSSLDPAADIDALLAVAAEIEGLTSAEPVTAGIPSEKLLAARATYQAALEKFQLTADAKLVAATDAAISDLRKLTGSLAASDDLDAALRTEEERRRLEADAGYLAAKERIATESAASANDRPASSGSLGKSIPRNGLFAHYSFDGNLNNSEGETPIRVENSRRFANGHTGRALNLSKPSGEDRPNISFPLPNDGRGDFSFSYCVRPDMSAHEQDVIFAAGKEGSSTPFWFDYQQSGSVGAKATYNPPGDDYFAAYPSLPRPELKWHHIVITIAGEESSYYLDGNLIMTLKVEAGKSIDLSGMHAYIGTSRSWHGSGDDRKIRYNGGPDMLLDELSVYTRVLSASEARSLAKSYDLYDEIQR